MIGLLKSTKSGQVVPFEQDDTADLANRLEQDIREITAPASAALPLPTYVEHHPEANDIGRLSAQALVAEYEIAAKSIEAMGDELLEMVKRCDEDTVRVARENEQVKAKVQRAIEDCQNTAKMYRERAAAIFNRVQAGSILAEDVSRTCAELTDRVAAHEPKKEGS